MYRGHQKLTSAQTAGLRGLKSSAAHCRVSAELQAAPACEHGLWPAEEFQRFAVELREPFRTVAVLCVSLGLRISECLALKWSDVDWLNGALLVQRGIVIGRVDETKTEASRRALTLAPEILDVLKTWKTSTQFGAADDWIFASPTQIGRLPWSYPWTWKMFQDAAKTTGLEAFGTHTLRHSYRSWLDAVGTTIAVQQKLMRHSDIRTTMNVYGTVVTDEMTVASGRVAGLAIGGLQGDKAKCS